VSRAIFDASRAIVICPSNPYLSIDPILSIPGVQASLNEAIAPVIAVSPIVGGQAVKGPTAKIMSELGVEVSNMSIAAHYHGLIDGLIVDLADADQAIAIDVPVHATSTLMHSLADRIRLAEESLAFASDLAIPRLERVLSPVSAGAFA
jgi:LPPG:FO 2-phospho-L-lactate transferase